MANSNSQNTNSIRQTKKMKKTEILNKLYKENSLEKEDVYKDKRGFTIITRSGIEKIQYKNNIVVRFKLISWELDNVVVKATSLYKEKVIESYASATKENCRQLFRVEIAEKRALARVIIKMMGLTNTHGQDEIDHQAKTSLL